MTKPAINHGDIPNQCRLLSTELVRQCIHNALNRKFSTQVDDDTTLKDQNGLGLDEPEIKNDLLHVIERAVEQEGCMLTNLTGGDLFDCDTVGEIVDKVAADILSN
jgi:hypothetical protein